MVISAITIWPALMFAARRNERVAGRTVILEDSMDTRKGFNQSGAPPGRMEAKNLVGLLLNDDNINASQEGSPREAVKIRCLETLKVYGISPIRFVVIIRINRVEMVAFHPVSAWPDARASWWVMSVRGIVMIQKVCDGASQKVDERGSSSGMIKSHRGGVGKGDNVARWGSKEEKMSVNIKAWGTHYWL